jgi:signal transduction histidine kinase
VKKPRTEEEKKQRRRFTMIFFRSLGIGFAVLAVLWAGVTSLAGWWASAAGFRWNPWVRGIAELWATLIVGLFIGILWGQTIGKRRRDAFGRTVALLNEAFAKISRGDFSVQVTDELPDQNPDNPFRSIIENVNAMAESLARVEELRRQFVADVSHEFQSPLTSILGFAQALKSELPADLRHRYLSIVETEARRLSKLSENLLRLNSLEDRDGPPDPAPFRLDVQIRRVLVAMEPQWNAKNLQIEADLAEASVTGNEELWTHVWTNLVQNAVKFTPRGGRVCLRLRCDPLAVEVEDSGIGLTPEQKDRVFERFYKADQSRTSDESSGSGLGLALVQRIVSLHGATVSVASPGLAQGTTFRVAFPEPAKS